jgi:hypothetical protein
MLAKMLKGTWTSLMMKTTLGIRVLLRTKKTKINSKILFTKEWIKNNRNPREVWPMISYKTMPKPRRKFFVNSSNLRSSEDNKPNTSRSNMKKNNGDNKMRSQVLRGRVNKTTTKCRLEVLEICQVAGTSKKE